MIAKRLLFLCLISLFIGSEIYPQSAGQPPAYQTIFSQKFGLADNFPDRCVLKTFVDPSGKLWVQPCRPTQQNYFIHLFQFDGTKAAVENWELTRPYFSRMQGVLPDGTLYGLWYNWGDHEDWAAFQYDLNRKKLNYFPADSSFAKASRLTSMLADEAHNLVALTEHQYRVTLSKLGSDGLHTLLDISREKLGLKPYPSKVYLMDVGKDGYWLVEERGFPILVNERGEIVYRYMPPAGKSPFLPKIEDEEFPFPKIFRLNGKRKTIFYLPWTHEKFFTEEKQAGQLKALPLLPPDWQMWPISFNNADVVYQDKVGNLLLLALNEKGERGGLLVDTTLQVFDYSPVLSGAGVVQGVMSDDFRKYAFISSRDGLTTAVVRPEEWIQTLPTGATRGITQISEEEFIIVQSQIDIQLLRGNIRTGSVAPFFRPGYEKDFYFYDGQMKILKNGEEHLWITIGDILYNCDTAGISCDPIPLGALMVKQVMVNEHTMALLSETHQLYFLDIPTQTVRPYLEKGEQPSFPYKVHDMLISRDRILWVATSWGLWRIDYRNQQSRLLNTADGFSDDRFLCMQEDERGRLWLGTFAGGLQIYDPTDSTIKVVDVNNGLSQNTVVTIQQDLDGDFWVATQNGLTLLDENGTRITELYAEDGLTDSEFNRYSSCRADDGKLLFGTVNGTNVIDPAQIKSSLQYDVQSRLFLTKLTYYANEKKTEIERLENLDQLDRILIPAGNRYLKLQFAISNYLQPQKNKFAYRLEGFDEQWNWLGERTSLELQSLPPGQYDLLIRGEDHRGVPAPEILRVPLLVKDFFYRQWWFYLGLFLVVITIGAVWILSLKRVNLGLESEVERRTQQIRQDRDLIEQQARDLQELDKVKSRFFANISHELRTPLTLIVGPLQSLLDEETVKGKRRNYLELMRENGRKLMSRINELLDLSKLEAREMPVRETPVRLSEWLGMLVAAYKPVVEAREVELRLEDDLPPGLEVVFDRGKVEKILGNYLANAIKYTGSQGEIVVSVSEHGASLEWSVSDTGPGIRPEELPHVFDRFYQAANAENKGGTGIGLSICRELAELMGGSVRAESRLGRGSTFYLRLPKKKSTMNTAEDRPYPIAEPLLRDHLIPLSAHIEPTTETEAGTILLVEDHADLRTYMAEVLSDYAILQADDGAAALALLNSIEEVPTLIVSDIMMPNLDGFGFLEQLKSDPARRQIPVVMLTARVAEEAKLKALRLGVDDYLTKPFSPRELQLRVHNLISNARSRTTFLEQEKLDVKIDFETTHSADQLWLEVLEKVAKEALEKQIDLNRLYLSDQMAISDRQLLRRLKSLTGLTIKQYILEVKLQKARHLLENGTYQTVAEVAYASGFNAPHYFSQLFEKKYGKRPAEY